MAAGRLRMVASASCVAVALILPPSGARGAETFSPHERLAQAPAPADLERAMAIYRRRLEEYKAARAAFEEQASVYWAAISDKRRARFAKRRARQEIALDDYVLTQPPRYSGPPKPVDPSAPAEEPQPRRSIPVVADFLQAALDHFRFVPQRPADELAYKRAYAQVAAAAGLTREHIVRVYAFEAGGNGKYDVQAGLEYSPTARAISTALGYNQLLTTNSVEVMAQSGDHFIQALKAKAARLTGPEKAALEKKISVVQAMMAVAKSVPNAWSDHERLGRTPKGLGIHAMVLDVDVGPLLQTQKLLDSLKFAQRNGIARPLTAAELEMMNLTGDGNGLDMVMMPEEMRQQVPTANFFQRGGYERNPVASRNNVVAKLIAATDAKMDRDVKLQGARDLAAAYPQ